MNEPIGVVGIVAPEAPGLLGLVTVMAAAMTAGNTVVIVPSESQALVATDLYQVLDTSDVPGGVVNIVTGDRTALGLELARHDAVDAIWCFGGRELSGAIEKASAGNLKQSWTRDGRARLGRCPSQCGREFLGQGDSGQEHLDPLRRIARAARNHNWLRRGFFTRRS